MKTYFSGYQCLSHIWNSYCIVCRLYIIKKTQICYCFLQGTDYGNNNIMWSMNRLYGTCINRFEPIRKPICVTHICADRYRTRNNLCIIIELVCVAHEHCRCSVCKRVLTPTDSTHLIYLQSYGINE